jgi:hypothetical protein
MWSEFVHVVNSSQFDALMPVTPLVIVLAIRVVMRQTLVPPFVHVLDVKRVTHSDGMFHSFLFFEYQAKRRTHPGKMLQRVATSALMTLCPQGTLLTTSLT